MTAEEREEIRRNLEEIRRIEGRLRRTAPKRLREIEEKLRRKAAAGDTSARIELETNRDLNSPDAWKELGDRLASLMDQNGDPGATS